MKPRTSGTVHVPARAPMHRMAVKAEDIESIGYDPGEKLLEVEFTVGGVYHYFEVPVARYELLMCSELMSKYFHKYIRDRYEFLRIA